MNPPSPVSSEKVLVTGGAGFIGSELVHQLAAGGHDVVIVDNLTNGRRENIAESAGHVRLVVADVRRPDDFAPLLKDATVVFHLACLGVRHSIHAPLANHDVNATGTLALLNASRRARVRRFVYVSSSEVYGTARQVPITEDHPTCPTTVYGASKLAGECYTRAFRATYGFSAVVVRPFNAYGPRCHHEGDSGEVIPKFLLRALSGRPMVIFGDGLQTRDFTYVADTARGIALAGFTPGIEGQTFNLGSAREISVSDLASKVAAVTGRSEALVEHVEPRPGDVRRLLSDSSRAKASLAFEPGVPLSDGLVRLRDWYLSLGVTPERLLEQEVVRNWMPRGAVS